ncbi:uncharacterized protein CTHT_0006110 [Thermochaetoides thermophila DSM 1495]|uniref:Uncharacterized protein n=1 Tax=Chaetomium thermophilum (strain DSM 1495 / CBS 144.50 / IMI 039719) TaxID=759272 RepID=G0RYB6_CHATD|nr:hypothetical protein CTHT_0006110 [Thermochaetoides thermophila DSM 1495]EGS23902.1 hypothetical protein CTHT_0006110 [Thermochaetoides thermophila DSM 1495]
MPPKRLLHSWNAETHEDVLIALLDIMKPVKEDWAKVMENLREKGYTFSEGALVNPTVWDHDAHLTLLQAVMSENPPTADEWERILKRVEAKGYRYTPSAAM